MLHEIIRPSVWSETGVELAPPALTIATPWAVAASRSTLLKPAPGWKETSRFGAFASRSAVTSKRGAHRARAPPPERAVPPLEEAGLSLRPGRSVPAGLGVEPVDDLDVVRRR